MGWHRWEQGFWIIFSSFLLIGKELEKGNSESVSCVQGMWLWSSSLILISSFGYMRNHMLKMWINLYCSHISILSTAFFSLVVALECCKDPIYRDPDLQTYLKEKMVKKGVWKGKAMEIGESWISVTFFGGPKKAILPSKSASSTSQQMHIFL